MSATLYDIDPSKIRRSTAAQSIAPRVGGFAVPRLLNNAKFSGYEDVTITQPVLQLTDEDLNTLTATGIDYYAEAGNGCTNKPGGVDEFSLSVIKSGATTTIQQLIDPNTGMNYTRVYKDDHYDDWFYAYTSANPQPLQTLVDKAKRLETARKISLSGSVTGEVLFDGSKDVEIQCDTINFIGDDNAKLELLDNEINLGGTSIVNSITFGATPIGDNHVPTDYYFGKDGIAIIHVSDIKFGQQSISDLYSAINHDHDTVYSKLDHKHDINDLEFAPDEGIKNPHSMYLYGKDGEQILSYDGSSQASLTITPEIIDAAHASHGIHVNYSDSKPVASYLYNDDGSINDGYVGTSGDVARSDHRHAPQLRTKESDRSDTVYITSSNTEYSPTDHSDTLKIQNIRNSDMMNTILSSKNLDNTSTIIHINGPSIKDGGTNSASYELGLTFANNINEPIIKIRSNDNTMDTWGSWIDVYTSTNKPSIDDLGGLSTVGLNKFVDDSNIPKS